MEPSALNFVMAGAILVVTGVALLLQRHNGAQQRADDLAEAEAAKAAGKTASGVDL